MRRDYARPAAVYFFTHSIKEVNFRARLQLCPAIVQEGLLVVFGLVIRYMLYTTQSAVLGNCLCLARRSLH